MSAFLPDIGNREGFVDAVVGKTAIEYEKISPFKLYLMRGITK